MAIEAAMKRARGEVRRCQDIGLHGQCVLRMDHSNKHMDLVGHSWGAGNLPTGNDAVLADGILTPNVAALEQHKEGQ